MQVGDNLWNARVYAGLSVASELADGLDRSKRNTATLFSAWKIYLRLGMLNNELEKMLSEYDGAVQFPLDIPVGMIEAARDSLLKLYSFCNDLQTVPNEVPFHNLINGRLNRLRAYAERIGDVADWFEVMSNPSETNAKFETAFDDLRNGNVIPWSAVR